MKAGRGILHSAFYILHLGEVAEWSIAAVLKTASALPPTGVRIPPSPPTMPRSGLSEHEFRLSPVS